MNAAPSKGEGRICKEAKVIPLRPLPSPSPRKKRKQRPVRFLVAVREADRAFDPLQRDAHQKRRVFVGAAYILAAVLFHLGAAAVLIRFGENVVPQVKVREPKNVLVNIEPPAAPEPEPLPPASEVEPLPEVAVQKATPKSEPKAARREVPKAAREIPSDPVDVPQTTPDTPPPRKVVGISFESTVVGGEGPALAVGNTRMGVQGPPVNPKDVKPAGGGAYRGPGTAPANRVAAAVPTDGISLVKPKRLSSAAPVYPAVLKAQGIEGDVAVLIRISADGAVLDARVVKGSGQSDFDKAALEAARRERFSPAERNGERIEYTLKYTYRFRVTG